MNRARALLDAAASGAAPSDEEAAALAQCDDLGALIEAASRLRDHGHGERVSYSRKVFIPLTRLCRDNCHYCTFAQPPRPGAKAYLTPDEVVAIARAGAAADCKEALFTLGDKPELRYRAARSELIRHGHATTIAYVAAMAALVLRETGLLPHLNCGVMSAQELGDLRAVSVSQGLMLETASERLAGRGGPHFGSPDKLPTERLATIEAAGAAAIPLTSGILIGIGETRRERIAALLKLRALHRRYRHLQEIIVQNFRAKPGTRMAHHREPDPTEHLWTVAIARILFGAAMNIQAPPNLHDGPPADLIAAGINDWGGVSPVTPDHVNPERPWPAIEALARATAAAGKVLVERLAVYPSYVRQRQRWVDGALHPRLLRMSDAEGFARADTWTPGADLAPPRTAVIGPPRRLLASPLSRLSGGAEPSEADLVALFAARGESVREICAAADQLRAATCGERVSYVVTRNINYTNVCTYRCAFCAFSKGRPAETGRDRAYDLDLDEIKRRSVEAWQRGAVEVCLQGGIHPRYTGATYLGICHAIKEAAPGLHIHAFSPLEIFQGAATLGIPVSRFLGELAAAGLGSLPGTAAEVLDDEVRAIICPDKISSAQWLEIVEAAHRADLRTTATIMFGHVDAPQHWARHLMRIRRLQQRTGGFTELVPLPFVPMQAPLHLRGHSRLGPTFREAVLMHAVARLALHPLLPNIQTSWVKMGPDGAAACLAAGANDLGGTLMNESITRAAGAVHGQEMAPQSMDALIRRLGRQPVQRTTLYRQAPPERVRASFGAAPLRPMVETAMEKRPANAATSSP